MQVRQSGTLTLIADYHYDALGRRVEKVLAAGTTTRYLLDGVEVAEEYDAVGNWQARYIYEDGIDRPRCMDRADIADVNGNQNTTEVLRFHYHQQALGSVTEVTQPTGAVVEWVTYDVYGLPTIRDQQGNMITQSAVGNPYLYTGREYDAEAGVYSYRTRTYDAGKGRFLQRDPAGYIDGLDLYGYAQYGPATLRDPTGMTIRFSGQDRNGEPSRESTERMKETFETVAAAAGLEVEWEEDEDPTQATVKNLKQKSSTDGTSEKLRKMLTELQTWKDLWTGETIFVDLVGQTKYRIETIKVNGDVVPNPTETASSKGGGGSMSICHNLGWVTIDTTPVEAFWAMIHELGHSSRISHLADPEPSIWAAGRRISCSGMFDPRVAGVAEGRTRVAAALRGRQVRATGARSRRVDRLRPGAGMRRACGKACRLPAGSRDPGCGRGDASLQRGKEPGVLRARAQAQHEAAGVTHEGGSDREDAHAHRGRARHGVGASAGLLEGDHQVEGDRRQPGANLVVHEAVVAHQRAVHLVLEHVVHLLALAALEVGPDDVLAGLGGGEMHADERPIR